MRCCCCLCSWILTKPPSIPTINNENHYHHSPIPTRLPRSRFRFALASFSLEKRTYSINNIFCWMDRQSRKSSQISAARLRACLLLLYFLLILLYYYSIIINVLRLSIVDTRCHPTPLYCEEKKASWHTLISLITTTTKIRGLCQDFSPSIIASLARMSARSWKF